MHRQTCRKSEQIGLAVPQTKIIIKFIVFSTNTIVDYRLKWSDVQTETIRTVLQCIWSVVVNRGPPSDREGIFQEEASAREDSVSVFSHTERKSHVRTQQENNGIQAKRRTWSEGRFSDLVILCSPVCRAVKKIRWCCPVCTVLLWQP